MLPTHALDLTARVNDYADHGLLGVAADANFASNGYLYLLYTYENDAATYNGAKTARLVRYTMVGDTASPASEQVLLGTTVGAGCDGFPIGTDCMPSENPSHSIGIDHFIDEAPTTYTYTATNVTAGTHAVKVEYYQGSGGATARVSWQPAAAPTATITAPTAALTYKVGDVLTYSGSATVPLPALPGRSSCTTAPVGSATPTTCCKRRARVAPSPCPITVTTPTWSSSSPLPTARG